jgi:pimeloyl-ACP methyl ester carboxylesterase
MTLKDFYANVPLEQVVRLQHFRETHPLKRVTINNVNWEYIACGQEAASLLWLVGGLRVADAAYRSIPLMENEFRIIAPSYPPLHTMAELTDGLAGLLDAEGVDRAHVLAGSFGGMVAQVFARRHAPRVDKLVLSTTAAPTPEQAEGYQMQTRMLQSAADELVAEFSKGRFLEMVAPPEDERAFWTAYIDELFSLRLGKADLLSTLNCMIDLANHYALSPNDLPDWKGRILVIEAEDDATFDENARVRLKTLYPTARIHTFTGGGHSPATTRREEYFALVSGFLKG